MCIRDRDYLKEGIGLRAMAQRDPLIEYEREGHLMFNDMTAGVKEDVVGYVYHLEVQVEKPQSVVPKAVSDLLKSAATKVGGAAGAAQEAGDADNADSGSTSTADDAAQDASQKAAQDSDAAEAEQTLSLIHI